MQKTLVLVAVAAVATLSCNEPVAPGTAGPAGEYPLRSVDGNPPPQIVSSDADGTISFVGGLVLLRANGTYLDSTEIEIVNSAGVTRVQEVGEGTYRISSDSVFFRVGASPTEYPMVRNGAELVQDFDGIILIYRR